MRGMFYNAPAFNQPLNDWDTSAVTDMSGMFVGATKFNQSINDWDTSLVTATTEMFLDAHAFNQPLNDWDTSQVRFMGDMFQGATSFIQPLDGWDTSAVTDMRGMFAGATSFNQPLSGWDTSAVTDMSFMFLDATSFNQSLTFDTSAVTDMGGMFEGATSINQPPVFTKLASSHDDMFKYTTLSVEDITYKCSAYAAHRCDKILAGYDVSFNAGGDSVCCITQQECGTGRYWSRVGMGACRVSFQPTNRATLKAAVGACLDESQIGNCPVFGHGPIGDWDTSLVTDMSGMFVGATKFNQPLDGWDTSAVTDMSYMFQGASSFKQSLTFDTSAVTNMRSMFDGASSFNQPPVFTKLASSHDDMFVGTTLSVANITYKCSAYAAHRCDKILAPLDVPIKDGDDTVCCIACTMTDMSGCTLTQLKQVKAAYNDRVQCQAQYKY
jgi:surface protein